PGGFAGAGAPGVGGPPPGGFAGAGAPGAGGAHPGGFAGRGVPGGGLGRAGGGFGRAGGGLGGADSGAQASAVAYARAHGGGTVVTSSQNGTSAQVIKGADIAAIGGFSGRESQVTPAWLADAVDAGRVRWVLTSSGGFGGPGDTRVGSRSVMTVVTQVCSKTTVSGLYDCAGKAAALRATTAS
ncbi:MAG TPA: hypothetical protein VGO81_17350, partial [Solirubrobacteraceae bacterium]|nr:hypothetical protein [Solirubrobacteraceae bacterium]